MARKPINNLIVVSDLHCGCRMGLCPNTQFQLDDGGTYAPSKLQRKVYSMWEEFWGEWVPEVCHGEPFAVAVNGDSLDGVHHGSVTQISHNLADQGNIGYTLLRPIVEACEGRFYMVRGTEAHVGKSGAEEERLAQRLGAIPDSEGRHARHECWFKFSRGSLVHMLHHIGTTGASHYESSAVMKELAESYAEAGRWRNQPPDVVIRSHRHRAIQIDIPTASGMGISACTAGWQLKTPFVYKIPGGRLTTPQIGGMLVRQGDVDVYTRRRVWPIGRTKEVQL